MSGAIESRPNRGRSRPHSLPSMVPPALTTLDLGAGWANCGSLTHSWVGEPSPTGLYRGRQLGCSLVCWIAGAQYYL